MGAEMATSSQGEGISDSVDSVQFAEYIGFQEVVIKSECAF